MISLSLQIELIVFALLFAVFIFKKMRDQKLSVKFSLMWLAVTICIIVLAVFPKILSALCRITGVETPSNLLFFLALFVLLFMCFTLTSSLSVNNNKTKRIVQISSIEKYEQKEKSKSPSSVK
ncbi:MAG: DUF2304 domain-containing protein [Acutalibacteraceae bacterium]